MARIRENNLIIPALKAMAKKTSGKITMTELIQELTDEFQPDGLDGELLDNRSDTRFSQKVRNLVSHRNTSKSMFTLGYADYHPEEETVSITDDGRTFLTQVPDAE